jgi:hypothetical protein
MYTETDEPCVIFTGENAMAYHPINLGVRFLLEIAGLAAMAYWGWRQADGVLRFVLAIGIPLVAAALWGTFAVPDDPSRSGKAPVPVPGVVRLALELAFFAFAVWALYDAGLVTSSIGTAVIVIIHYAVSYERMAWLLR